MPRFRCVDGENAGPSAVGILAPPGARTVLIVRPRELEWDLVALHPLCDRQARPEFWEVRREQAEGILHGLQAALTGGTPANPVVLVGTADGGFQVHVGVGTVCLVACRRQPGKPYRAAVFATRAEAEYASGRLVEALFPAENANREMYLNLRHFSR